MIVNYETLLQKTRPPQPRVDELPTGADRVGAVMDPHLNLARILVPVDFTPASLHALRYAATLAGRNDSFID